MVILGLYRSFYGCFFFIILFLFLWLDVDKLYDVLIKSINYVDKFVFQFIMIFACIDAMINFNVFVDSVFEMLYLIFSIFEIRFMSIKWNSIYLLGKTIYEFS